MKLKRKVKITLVLLSVLILIGSSFYFINNKEEKKLNTVIKNQDNNDNKEDSKLSIANLTLVGDFLFEQPFYDAIAKGDDINNYFKNVKSYFLEDDLSIGNMEVVIGNDNLESSGTGFNFCAPEYIGKLVNTLDLQVLGTANNHAYDRNIEGVNSTINFFKNNTDILTVGTYYSKEDMESDRILEINGIKFGFLAYTYGTNIVPSASNKDYINYYKDPNTREITKEYEEKLINEVSNLRGKVDVLIVIMHWGVEFTYTPNSEQKNLAQKLNELGVDIILGSHSHSIQPIEWINGNHKTLVYYSMGNFVSADDDISRTGETFDNAYQVGLLSKLKVIKENDKIDISDISTELIVNYYDENLRNFELVPFKMYNSEFETSHYRYKYNFNRDFIQNMYETVIDKEFR